MSAIAFALMLAITGVAACVAPDCSLGCTTVSVPAGATYTIPTPNCVAPAYMVSTMYAMSTDTFQVVVTSTTPTGAQSTSVSSTSCFSDIVGSAAYTNDDVTVTCRNFVLACAIKIASSSGCVSSVWQTSSWSTCTQCVQTRTAQCVLAVNGVVTATVSTQCAPDTAPALTQSCACPYSSTGSTAISRGSTGIAAQNVGPTGLLVADTSSSSSVSRSAVIGIIVSASVFLLAVVTSAIYCWCRRSIPVASESVV